MKDQVISKKKEAVTKMTVFCFRCGCKVTIFKENVKVSCCDVCGNTENGSIMEQCIKDWAFALSGKHEESDGILYLRCPVCDDMAEFASESEQLVCTSCQCEADIKSIKKIVKSWDSYIAAIHALQASL